MSEEIPYAYQLYDVIEHRDEVAALKADVRQWLNEAQRQQNIATEAYAEIAKLKDERDKWAHRAERLYSKLDEEHYTDQDTDRWFNSDGQAIIEAAE